MIAQHFLNRLQGDAYLGAEFQAQWSMLPDTSQLQSIFEIEHPI